MTVFAITIKVVSDHDTAPEFRRALGIGGTDPISYPFTHNFHTHDGRLDVTYCNQGEADVVLSDRLGVNGPTMIHYLNPNYNIYHGAEVDSSVKFPVAYLLTLAKTQAMSRPPAANKFPLQIDGVHWEPHPTVFPIRGVKFTRDRIYMWSCDSGMVEVEVHELATDRELYSHYWNFSEYTPDHDDNSISLEGRFEHELDLEALIKVMNSVC